MSGHPPRSRPGKCAELLPAAIVMTLFYGLPRLGLDAFRRRRTTRGR